MKILVHRQGLRYFNPRSREGSDDADDIVYVSVSDISILAPARGATLYGLPSNYFVLHFNPRSREGSDPVKGGI